MDLQDSLIRTFNWRKKLMLQAIAKKYDDKERTTKPYRKMANFYA